MAWCEDRTTRFGPHHFIYYRVNGARQKPLDGGYTEASKNSAMDKAKKYERDGSVPEEAIGKTMSEAIAAYLKDSAVNNDPNTIKLKKYCLSFVENEYGALPMRQLSIENGMDYRERLRQRFTADGAQMKFKVFKAMLRYCYRRDWIEKDIADRLEGIISKFNPRYLINEGEISRLLDACKYSPNLPELVALVLNSGLRQGEIFQLEDSQITDNFGFISLPPEVTKTDRGREVPILDAARPIIMERYKKGGGRLFPHWTTIGAMAQAFTRAVKRAKLGRVRFHDLRHTFAALYLRKGGRLNDLADILGHTNIQTTREFYSRFSKIHMKDQYNSVKMDALDMPKGAVSREFSAEYVTVKVDGEWTKVLRSEWLKNGPKLV